LREATSPEAVSICLFSSDQMTWFSFDLDTELSHFRALSALLDFVGIIIVQLFVHLVEHLLPWLLMDPIHHPRSVAVFTTP
jgi:hypothetical protein